MKNSIFNYIFITLDKKETNKEETEIREICSLWKIVYILF